MQLSEAGEVTRLEVVSYSGKTVYVEAKRVVLACGGIENARLLLNCDGQRKAGIGNENDLVGRYFMDHMNCTLGELVPADPRGDISFYEPHDADGVPLLTGLRLTDKLLRDENLLHTTVFLSPVWETQSYNDDFRDHSWVAFSAMAKAFARGQMPDQFWPRLCTIADSPGTVATGLYRHVRRRFEPPGSVKTLQFRQDAEQAPNPDSRVTLNGERDPFGLRRVTLDWRLTEHDLLSLRRTHELIGQAAGAAGIGRVRLGIDKPPSFDQIFTGYHHMGTTRMHADARKGVVDANCKVHSVANLYMAGSSVFTTGGTANPTLTITALAIRLASHLAAQV
jgi:choline dehydrogenase-like flavoprotein